jgi:hypothetical protein
MPKLTRRPTRGAFPWNCELAPFASRLFAQQPILSFQDIMLDTAVERHLELGNLLKHAEDSLMVCSLNFRRSVCARLAEDCDVA